MPCRDYDEKDYYRGEISDLSNKLALVEAALCGIARKHGAAILETIDFKQAGITKSALSQWWINHLVEDSKKIEEEMREKAKEEANQKRAESIKKTMAEGAELTLAEWNWMTNNRKYFLGR